MHPIREGDAGSPVVDVQNRLAALGFPTPADERHGVFGSGTVEAVRGFQERRGITVDGIVGPHTWRELVEASWRLGDRVLYLRAPHMRGDDVRDLQDRLSTFGFHRERIDGILGPQTADAVREFQRNYGLPPDGVVAEATLRALLGLPPIAGTLGAGRLRERISLRQRPGTLAGLRVVIDPGHGGDDPGLTGSGGAREDQICHDLARRVEALLAAGGAQPFLSRRSSDGPEDSSRAGLANALEADVFLSLHLGGDEATGAGATAHYFGHDRFHSEAGARLAELLLSELADVGFASRGSHPRTLAVLRETKMPAVLLELGRIADDEAALGDPAFAARIAAAIASGIARFAREPVPA